ncbi:hypothetical protein SAMN05421853_11092 [Roseivivax halotolerans]|uniref:Uncharacterized protein n=1 Tax=Roseivivax halotolerans TaxID=93684 RepID=A0A1I5ZJ25_9RHOB|nr:hypothetical protein [Roseivivax halotolerans]SFQ56484.1 hypothetical protein SAMN05421853_11092 [Roseivivax halotolerans]
MRYYYQPKDLPNELRKYCEEWSTGTRFMHPFRFDRLPFCSETDILTEISEQENKFSMAINEMEWTEALYLVEGWRYRFQYLIQSIEPKIPRDEDGDRIYWTLFFEAFRNSTNHFRQEIYILQALNCQRSNKHETLNGKDHATFRKLQGPITGWRGVNAPTETEATEYIKSGFSWSICKTKAEWFSRRCTEQDGNAFIAHAQIEKNEIEAYFPSAGEGEFIVIPSKKRQVYFEEL